MVNNIFKYFCSTVCFTFMLSAAAVEIYEDLSSVQKDRAMLDSKARGAGMSGSGSAVFGIFSSERRAKECFEALKADYPETFLCSPIKTGCFVE